jgi:hypothetical protein
MTASVKNNIRLAKLVTDITVRMLRMEAEAEALHILLARQNPDIEKDLAALRTEIWQRQYEPAMERVGNELDGDLSLGSSSATLVDPRKGPVLQ